ncbi:MAG: lysine-sensitive aspartokinase 3 [Nanoarchaeota archaeon]
MIVMKFGGSSVGNAERIKNVANIVKSFLDKKPVVVVSAVAKITDALIKLAKECAEGKGNETFEIIKSTHYEILQQLDMDKSLLTEDIDELSGLVREIQSSKQLNNKISCRFQSFGERMSSKIVSMQLNKINAKAQAFNSWQLGFITDSEFGGAEPLDETYNNLKININKLNIVPVITGFIGKTDSGEITTLGRGGSDYTAAIVGAAIEAEEIQIWTDVDGIMSTDPKIVKNAKTILKVSFAEASELAYFGAKVLHPKTMLPAMRKNIPVKVLNSFNPSSKGTTILNKADESKDIVKAIACKNNVTVIHIDSKRMLGAYGFLARLFEIFDAHKKIVDVVATSEVSVSITVDDDDGLEDFASELKEVADVSVENNKSIICVVGEGIKYTPGIAGRTFAALGNKNINIEMISSGASKINITFVVNAGDAEEAVKTLHQEFFG